MGIGTSSSAFLHRSRHHATEPIGNQHYSNLKMDFPHYSDMIVDPERVEDHEGNESNVNDNHHHHEFNIQGHQSENILNASYHVGNAVDIPNENRYEEDANENDPENQDEEAQGQENEEEALEAALPEWATAEPVNGYIKHPTAGFIMHPSFYQNRHLPTPDTEPTYVHDKEVDGPLCPPGQRCCHFKNCFEIRVRMAVMAYRKHNISFRDAEYIWRVSRSTIQRRKAVMDKRSSVHFLVTPDHSNYPL